MTNTYFNIHSFFFFLNDIIIAEKCDRKKKTEAKIEKEICVYGNVMVHRCPRRSHMKTGRGHGERGSRRERGKTGRDRKIRSEIQKYKPERLLETESRNKKGSLSLRIKVKRSHSMLVARQMTHGAWQAWAWAGRGGGWVTEMTLMENDNRKEDV